MPSGAREGLLTSQKCLPSRSWSSRGVSAGAVRIFETRPRSLWVSPEDPGYVLPWLFS